jgi:hypothetical protein
MTLRLNGSTSGYTEIDAPAVAGSNTLTLPGGNGTNGQVLTTDGAGALSFTTVAGAGSLADGSAAAPSVAFASDVNTGIFRAGNDLLAFSTGGTQRAVIDASGQLGIGVASPLGRLDSSWGGYTTGSAPALMIGADIGNTTSRTSSTRKFGLISGPHYDNGTDIGFIRFDSSTTVTELQLGGTAEKRGATDISFYTATTTTATPSERVRITNDGYVLIGCTSLPGGSTKGVGFYITGTDTEYLSSINTTASKNHIIFYNPNGAVGTIATNGSATAYNTSSDYRLKENVVPLTGAADRLSKLQVHRFNFIADPDTTVDGFLAHEAQAVVPECVTGTKDEVDNEDNPVYQGIDQSKLVPLLTAALQEAIAKIETLEARLTALEVTP